MLFLLLLIIKNKYNKRYNLCIGADYNVYNYNLALNIYTSRTRIMKHVRVGTDRTKRSVRRVCRS